MTPLFGLLSELREEIVELTKNLLLVAGGFLVGYILGGVGGWALGRWVLRQEKSESLQKLGRPVGGILLAIIVALIVFTGKGRSAGDGGGGKGSSSDNTTPGKTNASPNTEPKIESPISVPKVDSTPFQLTLRVTILAGTAVKTEGKFYLLDDDNLDHAMSLADLKKAIEERKDKVKGKVTLAILFPTDPFQRPPQNDQKVTDVTRWATEKAGLDVTYPAK